MRVLHVVKTSTGATWALRQIRELVALGVEVHVALPLGGSLVRRYDEIGAHVHDLNVTPSPAHPVRVLQTHAEARRIVARVRPDLLHLHNVAAAVTMRAALGRHHPVPRLFQVPGPLHMEHHWPRAVDLRGAGPRDAWIASCTYTRGLYLDAGVAPSRLGMSYYAVDVGDFDPSAPVSGDLRTDFDLDPSTRIVGMMAYMYAPKWYLGQRHGLKGHEDVIDAVALAVAGGRDLTAVFVGGAWAGAYRYEEHVRRYGRRQLGERAVFLGTRNDVASLYRQFDVVAHASHSENVGGAFESLLLEVPTVATTVGGLPELVHDGVTGWLVPPRQPRALAHALTEALDHPAEAARRSRAGRVLALELGNVQRTAKEILAYYEQALNSPASGPLRLNGV